MLADLENPIAAGADPYAEAWPDGTQEPEDATEGGEQPAKSAFVIDSDAKADWALRRIAQARENTRRWAEHYRAQLDAIRKEGEDTEAYFTALLARYFDTQPHRDTKTQSKYKLPSGELVRKRQAPDYRRDDGTLIECLMHGGLSEYVKVAPSVQWGELKKACTVLEDGTLVETNTGLVLEGVTAVQRPDAFEVKINA